MRCALAATVVLVGCGSGGDSPVGGGDANQPPEDGIVVDADLSWQVPMVPADLVGAYVKASNTDMGDWFGDVVAISADGTTLAVTARGESGYANMINGDQSFNGYVEAGAVYIYVWANGAWAFQAYVKPSQLLATYWFGQSLALSGDGNTLAVGVPGNDQCARGVNATNMGGTCADSGAVYTFNRTGTTWQEHVYFKASNNTGFTTYYGSSVALSADGSTLAVGSPQEMSGTPGINAGDGFDANGPASGAVYVYGRLTNTWSQQAFIKTSNVDENDRFGWSVALSADGNVLAAGAVQESSNATTVNGNQEDDSLAKSGAAYTFKRTGETWVQDAYIKASNAGADDELGSRVALSKDGKTLVVAARGEKSGSETNAGDDSAAGAGAVYVFTEGTGGWSQQAYLKRATPQAGDMFGRALALAADGNTLAVGIPFDDRAGQGTDPTTAGTATDSGAVELFTRTGSAWSRAHVLKGSNTEAGDRFGYAVAITADGSVVAAGAPYEASAGTLIDNMPADNTASQSGAVYVIRD